MRGNHQEHRPALSRIARAIFACALAVIPALGLRTPAARAEGAAEVAVSADGKRVAWVMEQSGCSDPGGHPRIHLLDLRRRGGLRGLAKSLFGSPELPVRNPATKAGATARAPAFSPDGRLLGFLSTRDGDLDEQLWLLPLEGGEAERWSRVPGGVADYAWAPDCSAFCLSAAREGFGGAILRLPADGSEAQLIHAGNPGIDEIALSFDGERIVYRSNETGDPLAAADRDLWVLNVATGETHRLTDRPGEESWPCWSEDGEQVFFLARLAAEEGPPLQGIFSAPAGGGPSELITKRFDQNILELATAADTDRLFAIAAEVEGRGLYRIRAREGKTTALVTREGTCRGLAVHRKGEKAFFVLEKQGQHAEIASWTFPDEEAELLTDFNAEPLAHPAPENLEPIASRPQSVSLGSEPLRLSAVHVLGSERFDDGTEAAPPGGWLIVSCEFSVAPPATDGRLRLSGPEADLVLTDGRGREFRPVGVLADADGKDRLIRGRDLHVAIGTIAADSSATRAFRLAFAAGELTPAAVLRAGDSSPVPVATEPAEPAGEDGVAPTETKEKRRIR